MLGDVAGPQLGGQTGYAVSRLPTTPQTASAQAQLTMTGALRDDLTRAGLTDAATAAIAGQERYAQSLPSVYADKITNYMQDIAEYRAKLRELGIKTETDRLRIQTQAETARRGQDITQQTAFRGQDITARGQDIAASQRAADRLSREAIAAARLAGSTGKGYGNLTAQEYAKLRAQQVGKINAALGQKGADPKNWQRPLDAAVLSGLRPADALAIYQTLEPVPNADAAANALAWLRKYLPENNAREVLYRVTSIDLRRRSDTAQIPPSASRRAREGDRNITYKPITIAGKRQWLGSDGKIYAKKPGG
jgi:hypothetical protein